MKKKLQVTISSDKEGCNILKSEKIRLSIKRFVKLLHGKNIMKFFVTQKKYLHKMGKNKILTLVIVRKI